ncbi:Protein of unknown function [Saccharopolyspora antimicrobica]|uniref:Uncharacterized protein DUF4245 n=1 Tax=Saccharopolyspora antimicrobica TaxID=455193 RepID=A0A1I4ZVG1_9PSEU|nr:DUF4245 domain-containing protein [Saccharopolyspora antimicrobica]RKT83393.1 uncharacterized protein DUF4245 [Saccharopolyspora antimicrobica]SFN53969.1 Protein of unknown function [Saccharopolyspora antimicrobica]
MGVVAEPSNQQPAPSRPPRTVSAMVFAILPLVLIAFGVAGLLGQCSFNPGGPSVQVPTVDVRAELDRASGRVDFPLADPELPANWRANSVNVLTLRSHAEVVRIGLLTGDGSYLRFSQSTAAEEELVTADTRQPPQALGTVDAGGRQWVRYQSVEGEEAWASERDGVRLLIAGNAAEPEFRTLAEAVLKAPAKP